MSLTVAKIVATLEVATAIVGAYLFWQLVLSREARARPPMAALLPWRTTVADLLIFGLLVVGGTFIAAVIGGVVAHALHLHGDANTVFTGSAAQIGMLAGVWICWTRTDSAPPASPPNSYNVLRSGAATFLISLPLLLITSNVSEFIVKALGLPAERQSLIAMFAHADSPLLLTIMIILAVIIAPLTEELVFRAGLFRYLRGWAPRWVALGVSAVIFASLHVNWVTLEGLTSFAPLVVLAVMFGLAYERTGKIGTSIVAHALFNLNTVILILSGLGT